MGKSKSPKDSADHTKGTKQLGLRRGEKARLPDGISEQKRQLRAITDNIQSSIAHIDSEQRYIYVNKRYADSFGRQPEEILGHRVADILGKAAYASVEAPLLAALQGEAQTFEVEACASDGHIRRYDVAYVPDVAHDCEINGLHILVMDITERWHAEQELKQHHDLLEAIINSTQDLIFAKDRNSRHLLLNAAAAAALGHSVDEMIGRNNVELFPPDLAREFDIEDQRLLMSGEMSTFENDMIVEGMKRIYHTTKAPIRNERGEIEGLVGISRDITERKHAEESLRSTTAYLDSILNNIPAGVAILEAPDFRYLRINKTLADINGLSIDDHIGKTIGEILPEAAKNITPRLQDALESGQATPYHEFSISLPGAPGDTRWLMDSFFPIVNTDGTTTAVGVLVMDITDRKQAEQDLVAAHDQIETVHKATTEKNVALRELMQQAGEERRRLVEQINSNVERILLPIMSKLESKGDESIQQYVTLLRSSLREISSSFVGNISKDTPALSPRELEITVMVREGMSSKEIASVLNTAESTVRKQRKTIRRKLGIANKSINLRSFLQSSTFRPT